eukprot:TRINITY_DN6290_c0_g1_i1.p1 TRINITY_DN6290_c0_g1~~TRINITY_DN6290_c0_g1_i1.p1  ORF type:complete len:557 (-),score=87.51 TRINITY_DN6290_c0_g1_i1:6-1676(-)
MSTAQTLANQAERGFGAEYEPAESRKWDILSLIVGRDVAERDPFIQLIEQYAHLQHRHEAVIAKNHHLTRSISQLQDDVARLRITGGELSVAKTAALEQKCAAQQDELLTLYKEKGELSTVALRAKTECQLATSQLQSAQQELAVLKEELAEREQALNAKEVLVSVLNNELQSLKTTTEDVNSRYAKLQAENEALLVRYMKRVEDEAQRMNQLQAQLEEKHLQHTQASTVARARKEVDGVVGSTIDLLDAGSGGLFATVPTRIVKQFEGSDSQEVNALAFNDEGTKLATGGNDSIVRVFDVNLGRSEMSLRGSSESIWNLQFSPDGRMLLAACGDKAARLWSLPTQRIVHQLTGHTGKVFSAVFTPNGRNVITGSADRSLKIWDVNSGHITKSIMVTSACQCVTPSVDGSLIFSGHVNGKVEIWTAAKGDLAADMQLHSREVTSIHTSSDGNYLLTNSRDNSLKLIDTRTYEVVHTLTAEAHRNGVNWNKACFSSDARYVAVGSADGSVHIWNVASGKLESRLKNAHKSEVVATAWANTGIAFASVDRQRVVCVWE